LTHSRGAGEMPRTIPQVVGRYCVRREIGRGGAAVVYEADDPSRGRRVALKVVAKDGAWGDVTADVRREARLTREVDDPRVVRVHDTGVFDEGAYLALELVDGRSAESLADAGALDWPEATALLAAACDGVRAIHAHGILHRDLKPANLMCGSDGTVKVIDFGLARALSRKSDAEGAISGTPHYMSPEQCRGDEDDERSDVYSLGASYYHLLTGSTPYADVAPLTLMFARCSIPTPDPRERRCLPEACAEIVLRAMALRRADRFGDARAMASALRDALNRHPT
jgi:serine/threonine-protein kinase